MPFGFIEQFEMVQINLQHRTARLAPCAGDHSTVQADQALYASKHGGRNRVTVYASPDASLPMTKDEAHAA